MKKCIEISILIGFIVFLTIFLLPQKSFAGYQNLNELNFQVDVKENGDIRITEFWDVDIEDTNTLFKTFQKDNGYDGIVDVVVTEIKGKEEIKFKKSNEYNYHVDENYYQALKNPDGLFEIAWGVNSSSDTGENLKFLIQF